MDTNFMTPDLQEEEGIMKPQNVQILSNFNSIFFN